MFPLLATDFLPTEQSEITTPTGTATQGYRQSSKVCGVSILRAGSSLEHALRATYRYATLFHSDGVD